MVRINFRSSPTPDDFNPDELDVDEYNAHVISRLRKDETLTLSDDGRLHSHRVNLKAITRGKHLPKPKPDPADFDRAICRGLKTLAERVEISDAKDVEDVVHIFERVAGRGFLHNPSAARELVTTTLKPRIGPVHIELQKTTEKYLGVFKELLRKDKSLTPLTAMAKAANMMLYDSSTPDYYKTLLTPRPIREGSSGVYYVKDIFGSEIAVFKPTLEGPYLRDNPKGLTPAEYRRLKSAGTLEERVGFELDGGTKAEKFGFIICEALFKGFAPETDVLSLKFPRMQTDPKAKVVVKEGSIQALAKGKLFANYGSYQSIPKLEIQKLCLCDLIMGNNDRNAFNFFYDEANSKITPIDHGLAVGADFILSDKVKAPRSGLDIGSYLYEDQLLTPIEEEVLDALEQFSIDDIVMDLKANGATNAQVRGVEVRYRAVKLAISKGFNLHQIGRMLSSFGKGNGLLGQIQVQMLVDRANGTSDEDSILASTTAETMPITLTELAGQARASRAFLESHPQTLKDPVKFYENLLRRFSKVLDFLDPETYLIEETPPPPPTLGNLPGTHGGPTPTDEHV